MKGRVISTILACLNLLLVEGLDTDDTRRILIGDNDSRVKWPWIVRLSVPSPRGTFIYGGSVIARRWILTSAHAARAPTCSAIEIYPSTWKPGDTTSMRPELCVYHPWHKWNKYFFHNIGLLKSNQYLLDPFFATINLPPEGTHNCPGDMAQIFGWRLDQKGLQWAPVKIESWKKCNEEFKRVDFNGRNDAPSVFIPKTGFCTNGTDFMCAAPSCLGDSGGPVIVNSILTGIIDGGLGDELGECLPISVHLNIADYLPWIYSVIEPQKDTSAIIVDVEAQFNS